MPILRNVKAAYIHMLEPNTMFDPHKYQLTAGPLTEDQMSELDNAGLSHRVGYGKDHSPHINFSTKVINPKTGALNKVPNFVDKDGTTPYTSLIGAGSLVNVMFVTYKSTFNGKTESILEGVQVVDAKDYDGIVPGKFEELPF